MMTASLIIKDSHCNEMFLSYIIMIFSIRRNEKTSLYNRISFCLIKSNWVLLEYQPGCRTMRGSLAVICMLSALTLYTVSLNTPNSSH